MRAIVRVIDSISEYTGKVLCWACVALVIVLVYEVTARHVFNAPTIWALETSCMLGATIASLGWAYVHRHHGHVRVDVFYTRLSPRGKALTDVICSLLLLFPWLVMLIYTSASWTLFSLSMGERLVQTNWYPPAAPIRLVMTLGLFLFALQCVAQFIRDLYLLTRNKPYD